MSPLPAAWRPFAKAIAPAVLTLAAILIEWIITGAWSRTETVTAITGLLAAVVTYLVPNTPVPAATTAERVVGPTIFPVAPHHARRVRPDVKITGEERVSDD